MDACSDDMAAAAAGAEPSARAFSQVVFMDIPHSYPPSTPVTCHYTVTAAFQPNPRDWVGIFKVGWSTTKDYHTFVWVEPGEEDQEGQQALVRQAGFKDYYLPKDELDFYQFCYVDSSGQVRGASTPFCFKTPAEHSVESCQEDDLLVITTQEQVEQSVREKAELMEEVDQLRKENRALKTAAQEREQQARTSEEQNEKQKTETADLLKELDRVTRENVKLRRALEEKQQETDQMRVEMTAQMLKQVEMRPQSAAETQTSIVDVASRQNEKYDRAVKKINQLKEEHKELQGRMDAQCEEIARLNSKVREGERELFKMRDNVQLLQFDLQSSEKEKGRLAAELKQLSGMALNMDEVKRENRELCRRLSQQTTPPGSTEDENLKAECRTLRGQLQEAQVKLAAAKEESRNAQGRAEMLERELQRSREHVDGVVASHQQEQRKSGKQELQLREAHEMIADKVSELQEAENMMLLLKHEYEELAKENQTLKSDMEGLRRAYTDSRAPPDAAATADNRPDAHEWQQVEEEQEEEAAAAPEELEDLYNITRDTAQLEEVQEEGGEEEQALVCRHCHEVFPGITRGELEQHEQSHRVCPFCHMICDAMEQSVFEDHVYSHEL